MPDSDYAKTPDRNSFSTRCFQVFTHERNKNSRCPASRKVVKKWKLFRPTPTSKAHLFSGKPYSQTREFTQRSTCVTATLPLVVRAAPLVVWRLKTSDSRANMFRHQRLTLRNFSSRRKCNSRKPASLKTSNHAQNISVNIRHFSSRRK